MSTKYTKVTAIVNGTAEVLYLTDADFEKCRKRVGKEGCEDASVGQTLTIADIINMPRTDGNVKRKVLLLK